MTSRASRTVLILAIAGLMASVSDAAAQQFGVSLAGQVGYASHSTDKFEAGMVLGGEAAMRFFAVSGFTRIEQETLPAPGSDTDVSLTNWTIGLRYYFLEEDDLGVSLYLLGEMLLLSDASTTRHYGEGWGVGTGIEAGRGSVRGVLEFMSRMYTEQDASSDFTLDPSGLSLRAGLLLFLPFDADW